MRRADFVLTAIPCTILSGVVLERLARIVARVMTNRAMTALSDAVSFTFLGFVLAIGLIVNEVVRAPAIES